MIIIDKRKKITNSTAFWTFFFVLTDTLCTLGSWLDSIYFAD